MNEQNNPASNNQSAQPVDPSQNTEERADHRITRTGASDVLVALSAFFIILLLIVVFIFQNMSPVQVSFLWMHGNLPLALAMLLSVISGALLMALAAGARVLQLRHAASRHRRDDIDVK